MQLEKGMWLASPPSSPSASFPFLFSHPTNYDFQNPRVGRSSRERGAREFLPGQISLQWDLWSGDKPSLSDVDSS